MCDFVEYSCNSLPGKGVVEGCCSRVVIIQAVTATLGILGTYTRSVPFLLSVPSHNNSALHEGFLRTTSEYMSRYKWLTRSKCEALTPMLHYGS